MLLIEFMTSTLVRRQELDPALSDAELRQSSSPLFITSRLSIAIGQRRSDHITVPHAPLGQIPAPFENSLQPCARYLSGVRVGA